MSLKSLAGKILKNANLLPLYDALGGLSEFWALLFGICGIILAFKGKLDANYAAMITAVLGILTAHDALDDWHTRKMRNGETSKISG